MIVPKPCPASYNWTGETTKILLVGRSCRPKVDQHECTEPTPMSHTPVDYHTPKDQGEHPQSVHMQYEKSVASGLSA